MKWKRGSLEGFDKDYLQFYVCMLCSDSLLNMLIAAVDLLEAQVTALFVVNNVTVWTVGIVCRLPDRSESDRCRVWKWTIGPSHPGMRINCCFSNCHTVGYSGAYGPITGLMCVTFTPRDLTIHLTSRMNPCGQRGNVNSPIKVQEKEPWLPYIIANQLII